MQNESIYQFICRMANEHPGLPYDFQDPLQAGRADIQFILWEQGVSAITQERLALQLVDLIIPCLETGVSSEDLQEYLINNPLCFYYNRLYERLNLYISEKLINNEKLYQFGLYLATETRSVSEVKLGILILGFFDNDISRKLLWTLGLHSEFTLYMMAAIKKFKHYNSLIYRVAKNTCGYGKLIALHFLDPVLEEMQEWVFYYGAKNEIMPHMAAIISLEKADMAQYYLNKILDKESFTAFSYLFAYAFEYNQVQSFTLSLHMVVKYMESAPEFANKFIDLAALIAIYNSMVSYCDASYEKEQNGWSDDIVHWIEDVCDTIFQQKKWKYIVLSEMNEPMYENSQVISAMKMLDLTPNFENYLPMLERDLFDLDIFEYLLIEHREIYVMSVVQYMKAILPDEVFTGGPLDIEEKEITSEYKPDICLVFTLKAMRTCGINDEDFFLKCLSSRFPDSRIEAIRCLRKFKQNWNDNVIIEMERAYKNEPVTKIKKQLMRAVNSEDKIKREKREYIDIKGKLIPNHEYDVLLLQTEVAGVFYRDLYVVESELKEGDLLCLVRQPDNVYDKKAILVTTYNGYVVGYIPRRLNTMPASLMDSGENLYGVLESIDIDANRLLIRVMFSKSKK